MDALRAFGAIVDKTYEGIRITAPNGLTGREHRAALPERRARPSRCC
jgi:UDP-N-acetylglucosamine 1-carboxyvinyltransferase